MVVGIRNRFSVLFLDHVEEYVGAQSAGDGGDAASVSVNRRKKRKHRKTRVQRTVGAGENAVERGPETYFDAREANDAVEELRQGIHLVKV